MVKPPAPLRAIARSLARLTQRYPFSFFVGSRLLSMTLMLVLLGLALFALMQLSPGDAVDSYVRSVILQQSDYQGEDNIIDPARIAETRARLGLDQPFWRQYGQWLRRLIVERDLGRSLISQAPILFLIKSRIINSLILNLSFACISHCALVCGRHLPLLQSRNQTRPSRHSGGALPPRLPPPSCSLYCSNLQER